MDVARRRGRGLVIAKFPAGPRAPTRFAGEPKTIRRTVPIAAIRAHLTDIADYRVRARGALLRRRDRYPLPGGTFDAMTTDPKQPFPFDELHRHGARGVDHARRIQRVERGGLS